MNNAQQILDTLIANLPLFISIAACTGLLGFIAGHMRRGLVEARKAAKLTPSKLDDLIVEIVSGPILIAADLVERGDLEGGKRHLLDAKKALEAAKAGKLPAMKAKK